MPSISIEPSSKLFKPSSISSVVVLPAPFGPSKPNISPSSIFKLTSFTAKKVSPDFSGLGYFFIKFFYKDKEKYADYEQKFYHIEGNDLENTILEKLNETPNTLIISDHKVSINKFNKIDMNTRYLLPNASHLANSFFKGYGIDNLDIIYHHTYYK